jgi:hypothetical protein
VRALLWPMFACSAWAEPGTVVTGTKSDTVALACVCSVGVGSASDCEGWHEK